MHGSGVSLNRDWISFFFDVPTQFVVVKERCVVIVDRPAPGAPLVRLRSLVWAASREYKICLCRGGVKRGAVRSPLGAPDRVRVYLI